MKGIIIAKSSILVLFCFSTCYGIVSADDFCYGRDELVVQYGGTAYTAQCGSTARQGGICIQGSDEEFYDEVVLPISLFKGSGPGTRAPIVQFRQAGPETFYTLLMIDPDAPNAANPTAAPWLHWMVVNILGEHLTAPNEFIGDTKKAYAAPTPPAHSGFHHYQFLLFPQPGYLKSVRTPADRARFDLAGFVREHRLGRCIAHVSFKTEKP